MKQIVSEKEWLRRKKIKNKVAIWVTLLMIPVIVGFAVFFIREIVHNLYGVRNPGKETIATALSGGAEVQIKYLRPNPYSRPGTELKRINGVVVHYTANPGTSAANNRNYFEGLAVKGTTYASSHYIIGLEGEIIQCIPLTEICYASNERNKDTIAIECCHPDETGKFNEETYRSLVSLTAALCYEFDMQEEDIIRHYDVTGKLCPLYYVENEEAWTEFRQAVMDELTQLKNKAKKQDKD